MTKDQLNEYILHYINEDKTGSAIMLTAPWGSGKTYYIQNNLIPFLKEKDNKKCIVVSLYGLKNLYELSKAIYLECRLKLLNKDSEKIAVGKLAVSTVVKGVASFFNVDLSKSEDDLKSLYESIDLSDKLIIIEDLERSDIVVNNVLGYVNNLVEQDGVKVLLVANEDEILKYMPLVVDDPKNKGTAELYDEITNHEDRNFTELTEEYLKTKEKTVSDTIHFEEDYRVAAKNIINSFESGYLSRFSEDNEITDIIDLFYIHEITNLRTFIFACQKTVDIYRRIELKATEDSDFIKTIFYSIIIFSNRLKNGFKVHWKGNDIFSVELSWDKYPLFRFCYDYIIYQTFDKDMVEESKKALAELRLYDQEKSSTDNDIKIISSWWIRTEKEVINAVNSVTKRLLNENDISFYVYDNLAFNLVKIKEFLGCNIDEAKKLLVKNIHNKGNKINANYLFTSMFVSGESDEVKEEYILLKKEMTESLAAKETTIFDFDYKPESIKTFIDLIEERRRLILDNRAFASRLNMQKVCEMLKECDASQIQSFRYGFVSVYRSSNIKDFLSEDVVAINELLEKVRELKEFEGYDKIQKLQIDYFEMNLKDILEKLR